MLFFTIDTDWVRFCTFRGLVVKLRASITELKVASALIFGVAEALAFFTSHGRGFIHGDGFTEPAGYFQEFWKR